MGWPVSERVTTFAEVVVGTEILTKSGSTKVAHRWDVVVGGKDRIGLSLENGLVYTNLRPYDTVTVKDAV